MPLPDRTKVTASNHNCPVRLDISTNSCSFITIHGELIVGLVYLQGWTLRLAP